MLLDFSIFTPLYVSLTWAFILILSSKANRARLVLGVFMMVVAAIFLSHVVYFHHLKDIYLYFDLMFVFGSLCIFPTYYLYIKLLTYKSRIEWNEIKHFLPAIGLLVAVSVTYLCMTSDEKVLYIKNYLYGIGKFNDASFIIQVQLLLGYLLQLLYFLQIVFSFIKIRQFVSNYNHRIANFYSNLEDKTLEWPKMILYSFAVSSIFTIITNFLGRAFFDKSPLILLITCIAYSVLLFILGYLGYMQNHTVKNLEEDTILDIAIEPTIDEFGNEPEKASRRKFKNHLRKLFEKDLIYKNPELKISDIACKLNTNRTYISSFINSEYGCSFSTYVNRHRVNVAKEMLSDEKNRNFSLEHIATLAGFGSLHSFIRAFKEIADTTPGKFRDSRLTSENDKDVKN
jgi:AraC-like DNA-binding protein